ncbi:GNAT family N-acetyltransferase [Niveispirillum sp. SYP-B3756]|uniref:GNAT family N-acetyltransferase n=1 Tax=Niveispirillum sp. SYP-B3756 TaxID=2662178 RepID=UPI001291EEB7|nr:GNAT family N-acetyltransferase [Niveispirillum sp. SYP-B3756]MQP66988.1 GNAT family N-acetyltransferase [Niveispirillum sp. SYP-B3756]
MHYDLCEVAGDDLPALLPDLVHILRACVDGGASVGFVQPLTAQAAACFWQNVFAGVRSGYRHLLVATMKDKVVGTAQLNIDMPTNGRHRAELCKLLVHPDARRRGIAGALIRRAVEIARSQGKRLLVLDTRSGTVEPLYAAHGFQLAGQIPFYAQDPDNSGIAPTSVMYRLLPEPVAGLAVTAAQPGDAAVTPLLDALSADLLARFGSDGRRGLDGWGIVANRSAFALAWLNGRPVGCGAVRPLENARGTAEIKRMYALPGTAGVGAAVLTWLEDQARTLGYRRLVLETRWANDRACAFYRRHGYRVTDNFGHYVGRTESACFAKGL